MDSIIINRTLYRYGNTAYTTAKYLLQPIKTLQTSQQAYWVNGPKSTYLKSLYYTVESDPATGPKLPKELFYSGDLDSVKTYLVHKSLKFSRSLISKYFPKRKTIVEKKADIIVINRKFLDNKNIESYKSILFDGNEYYDMTKNLIRTLHPNIKSCEARSLTILSKEKFKSYVGKLVYLDDLMKRISGINCDLSIDEIKEIYSQVLSPNKSVSILGIDAICSYDSRFDNIKRLIMMGALINQKSIKSTKSELTKLFVDTNYRLVRSKIKYQRDINSRMNVYGNLLDEHSKDKLALEFINSSQFINSFFGLKNSNYSIKITKNG